MQKGRSGMGIKKHRQCAIHCQPIHESVKMDMERQDNRRPIKRPKPDMHESMKDLMKTRK